MGSWCSVVLCGALCCSVCANARAAAGREDATSRMAELVEVPRECAHFVAPSGFRALRQAVVRVWRSPSQPVGPLANLCGGGAGAGA